MSLRLAPANNPERYAPLVRVFRRGGEVVATLTKREWFDPDNDGLHSYGALVTTATHPVAELLRDYVRGDAWVWLAEPDLWDAAWGRLAVA